MRGAITSRDVILHPIIIIRLFGLSAYARCLRAVVAKDGATFLDVVCASAK